MTVNLDEVDALEKVATVGPWEGNGTGCYVAMMSIVNERIGKYISAPQGTFSMSQPDIDLIVALRNNARAMIDELRKLRRENTLLACLEASGVEGENKA